MDGTQILCEASITLGLIEHIVWPVMVFLLVVVFLLLFYKEIRLKIKGAQQVGLGKVKIILAEGREDTAQRAESAKSSESSQARWQIGTSFNVKSL